MGWSTPAFPPSFMFQMTDPLTLPRIFYVDTTLGNDGNSGRSIAAPWKTIARVNAEVLHVGDRILFKCGETFPGQITPAYSGTIGAWIIYDCYGTGALPIIDGSAASAIYIPVGTGLHHIRFNNLNCSGSLGVNRSVVRLYSHDLYIYNCDIHGSVAKGLCAKH